MTPSPVCIRCGDNYSFTRMYKGNYCPDCHEAWSTTPRSEVPPRPRSQSSRTTSSVHQHDDNLPRPLEPPYDDE
ncbi:MULTISPECIES: hypothetical protein [Haloferax]|uniref:Small CPxCG-related zinc finger protein n=2 Tax=Haloferax TaxID=2251 RepID=A0A6G1YYU4_9EURY|nr:MULTISPECIES: hypothetical protein [Haloferax]KAB1186690.1 hypothetical protein Hfx1149_01060 [Haloferax sp. CBA1149]MRW79311.1 hypothetical protein [Haloferax marinisediminis]